MAAVASRTSRRTACRQGLAVTLLVRCVHRWVHPTLKTHVLSDGAELDYERVVVSA
jgi:hypothetical protein